MFVVSHHENNWLWHRRLGHASMHTIQKLAKHEVVHGFLMCSLEHDHLRDACAKSE